MFSKTNMNSFIKTKPVMLAVSLILAGATQGAHALAITGASSGIFTNPTGSSSMVVTGVGTSTFTWGNGPSSVSFAGSSFNSTTGTFFDVGNINFVNGASSSGTLANSVDLQVTLNFTSPSGVNQGFTYLLGLVNTTNTSDPNASADILQFPSSLPSETFTVDNVLYTLGLEVGTVSGSGFSSQTTFSVLEGQSAIATLRGVVTEAVVTVPEPTSLALFGIGAIGFARFRKNNLRKLNLC